MGRDLQSCRGSFITLAGLDTPPGVLNLPTRAYNNKNQRNIQCKYINSAHLTHTHTKNPTFFPKKSIRVFPSDWSSLRPYTVRGKGNLCRVPWSQSLCEEQEITWTCSNVLQHWLGLWHPCQEVSVSPESLMVHHRLLEAWNIIYLLVFFMSVKQILISGTGFTRFLLFSDITINFFAGLMVIKGGAERNP